MASTKNSGNNVFDSSLSKESKSSIVTSKLLEIANNVLPEHSKISALPEEISVKVVFGTPLSKDKEYTVVFLSASKSKNVMLKLYRLTDLFSIVNEEKTVPNCIDTVINKWSGRQDLNLRPSVPKTDAIPSYATSRNGAPDKNRTRNLLVRSQTLYPVELQAHNVQVMEVPTGFGPMIIELQSIALPTWLRNHSCSVVYYSTAITPLSSTKINFLFAAFFSLLTKRVFYAVSNEEITD